MIKRLVLITAIALINFCHAQYAATDLSYTCLGSGKYRVKLDIYTECKTNGSMVDRNIHQLIVSSKKLKVTVPDVFLESVSATDHVRLFCKSDGDVCDDVNSPNRGLRLATFYTTLDLSSYPATDDWEVVSSKDDKDYVFTHLVHGRGFANLATLNINTTLATCNSSPSFTARPILKACVQNVDTLNLGIIDTDQDELRFSFSDPITIVEGQILPFVYQTNYSPLRPMNLNSDLKITPDGKLIVAGNQHLDVGATDLIIDEYRNGVKIGSTRRNLQINVLNCVNQKPTVSTFVNPMNASKRTEITVCSADTLPKLNSLINITDVDNVIDSLPITFSINNVPVPNSDERIKDLFQTDNLGTKKVSLYAKRVPVFSTSTDAKITMHVKGYDNGCPIREFDEETFTIWVKARPFFDFAYDQAFLNCDPPAVLNPNNIPDLVDTDTTKPKNLIGNAPFTYQWKIWNKTTDGTYFVVKPQVYADSRASHTVDVYNHGITLKVTDANGCSYKDSVYFENGLEFKLDAFYRCFGNDSTEIRDLSISHDSLSPIVKRTWNFGDGDINSSNNAIVKKKFCKEGLYKISLEIETEKGCKAKFDDSLRIYSLPEPNFSVATNCMNRMLIDDKSFFTKPLRGGIEDLKSTPYGIQYFATKVYSGKDSSVEVKVQTRAFVNVVCDTIIVRFDTDSAASNCGVHNVAPVRSYGFNYTKLPSQPLSKIFRVTEDANQIYFYFKPFEFQTTYLDTTLLASNEIVMAIPKLAIRNRLNVDFDTLVQNKSTNVFKKNCKSFVQEDALNRDVYIPPHPSSQTNDFIFPNFTFDWEKQNNRIQVDSGLYLIKQVISTGQCRKEVFKEVIVYAEPQIDIANATLDINVSDTLLRNCYGGDTTLYAKALKDPNGGLKYRWLLDPNSNEIDIPIFTNSTQASAIRPGNYVLYVQDRQTCDDTTKVTLVEYLKADFDVFPDCKLTNDTLTFKNWSVSGKGPKIVNNRWHMRNKSGDFDTSFVENSASFKKIIHQKGELYITLTTSDSLHCEKMVTDTIMRSNFVNDLRLWLDSTDASFCVSDKINAHAIRLIGDNNQIDSIVWFPGDGRKLVQPGGKTNASVANFSFTYPNDSTYSVSYIAYFDGISRILKDKSGKDSTTQIIKRSCEYKSDSTQRINIKPEFKGKLFKFRTCIPDTVEFIFEKDPRIGDNTAKVKTIKWHVDTRSTESEPGFTFPIKDNNVFSFKKVFTKQHDLIIKFSVRDDNGCLFYQTEEAEVKAMDKPAVFGMDSVCLGTESRIRIRHNDGKGGGTIRYSVDYLNTQVAYNPFITKNNTETVKYTFPYPGVAPIRVSAHFPTRYESSINGQMRAECRGVTDTSIYIKPYPTPFFHAPPKCTRYDTTEFTNLTEFLFETQDPKDSIIVGYIWDFGDGSPKSNVEHPRHVYQTGGNKTVKLISVAANGCTADTTIGVGTLTTPTSYFTMDRDSTLINFNDPITFTENAQPHDNIERYQWDFGDGEIAEGNSGIIHQYKNIDRFQVSLKVTSKDGCEDTYTKTAELKPILLLPNVFSPNEDGQNDQLFLIYRLIEDLEDFKIYNRWGEVVFDAKGDLKARWDGKHKGTDQELGVYVAYVKARGKYGYTYNFKQNITLLR